MSPTESRKSGMLYNIPLCIFIIKILLLFLIGKVIYLLDGFIKRTLLAVEGIENK